MQVLLAVLMRVTLMALTLLLISVISAGLRGDLVLEIVDELKLFANRISFFALLGVQRALDLVNAVVYHAVYQHAGLPR